MNRLNFRIATRIKIFAATALVCALGFFAMRYVGAPPGSIAETASDTRPRVEVVYPRRATVAQRLQSNATLEGFEEADLFARVSGYLSEVRVDIGDHVKEGQIRRKNKGAARLFKDRGALRRHRGPTAG